MDIFCILLWKRNKKTIWYLETFKLRRFVSCSNKSHWKKTLYLWLRKTKHVTITFCFFINLIFFSFNINFHELDNIKRHLHIMNLFKSCILECWGVGMHVFFCIFMRLVHRFLLHSEVFFRENISLKKTPSLITIDL